MRRFCGRRAENWWLATRGRGSHQARPAAAVRPQIQGVGCASQSGDGRGPFAFDSEGWHGPRSAGDMRRPAIHLLFIGEHIWWRALDPVAHGP